MSTIFRCLVVLALSAPIAVHGAEFTFIVNDSPMDMGHLTKWVQFENESEMCLIDTGARKTTMKTLFLDRDVIGREPSGGLGGIDELSDLIKVAKITLDDWTAENLIIRRTQSIPTNCIIGNDIFMKQSFMINIQKKIFSTDFIASPSAHQLSIHSGHWFGFSVKVGSEKIDSLFDTGAGATLIEPLLIEKNPENFEFVQDIDITDGANKKLKSAIYKMKHLTIEDQIFSDLYVLAYPLDVLQKEIPSIRIILGFNLIRKQNWWFDFERKKWGHEKFK